MEEKQKRQLTPEQLENLKKGREKARLLNLQKKEIADVKKETKKEKEAKLKEEYEKVIEKKKQKEAAPAPVPPEESEESEEEQETAPPPPPQPPKRVRAKPIATQPAAPVPQTPPPVAAKPRQRAPPRAKSDAELYGEASIEMLRKKLQQETRQRLLTELFNY